MTIIRKKDEQRHVQTPGQELECKRQVLRRALGDNRAFLVFLGSVNGMTQEEIADGLGVDQATASRQLDVIADVVRGLRQKVE